MPYDGPGGQYMSGSPDGSRPGKFQVNVIRPEDKYVFRNYFYNSCIL